MTDEMPVAIVTGGGGFIGRSLVRALRELGVTVFSIGHTEQFRGTVDCLVDIRDALHVHMMFDILKPNWVFHLAAKASVRESAENPSGYMETNISGTMNVLEACRVAPVTKFVFASSGGTVYGDPDSLPVPITAPTRPKDFYGLSKLSGEMLVKLFLEKTDIDYYNLRYPNVYGPGQDPDGEAGVVAIFTKKMILGQPITINGDGLQTRDFMYVEDVVDATLATAINAGRGVYNVGTGIETSVRDIVTNLVDITGFKGESKFGPEKKGEVRNIALEPTLPYRFLTLHDGLSATVEGFRERLKHETYVP